MLPPTKNQLDARLDGVAYLGDDDIHTLCQYAAAHHGRTVVEIGVGFGASTVLLLQFSDAPHVISIDPFTGDSERNWRTSPEQARRNVRAVCGLEGEARWFLLQQTSADVARHWMFGPVDLLVIDGDHTYEAVRQDVDLWGAHMRSGGVVLLHDSRRLPDTPDGVFARGWPGPTRVAEELLNQGKWALIGEGGSFTVWQT